MRAAGNMNGISLKRVEGYNKFSILCPVGSHSEYL